MGSSFTVYNDTDDDIYLWNGVQWDYVLYPIGAIATVPVAVASSLVAGPIVGPIAVGYASVAGMNAASAAIDGVSVLVIGSFIQATVAKDFFGEKISELSAGPLSLTDIASKIGKGGVEKALTLLPKEYQQYYKTASDVTNSILEFMKNCEKLSPGQKHTYKDTLSMTRSVYLMKTSGEIVSRGCWTGATDGSNIEYNVSKDWTWNPDWKILKVIRNEH